MGWGLDSEFLVEFSTPCILEQEKDMLCEEALEGEGFFGSLGVDDNTGFP